METVVEKLAAKHNITKKDAKAVVHSFLEIVTEEIVAGNKVAFLGFGSFEKVDKKARQSFNPKEKKVVTIPATSVPKFKAGSKLKAAVKGE